MENNIRAHENHFLLFTNYIPKNKILYGLFLLLKTIPLFIVTHDWNISSNKGISFYIRKITLSEFLNASSLYNFYIGFILMIFCIFIYIFIIQIILLFHKIKSIYVKIYGYCIFYIFYGLNQYIYSIFVEILFNEKKKDIPNWLYYSLLIIIIILFCGIGYFNIIICSLVINEPIFLKTKSFLINQINNVDIKTILMTTLQIFIQLEFHFKFKTMMFIKNIVRGLFVLYYLKEMFSFNRYYKRFYIECLKRFYHSICFFSCLIEWIFYYDIENKLIILQKDFGIIILKLIIEINLSIIICAIYFHFDNRILEETILNFSSKNSKSFDYNLIKLFNMLYYGDRTKLLKKNINEIK